MSSLTRYVAFVLFLCCSFSGWAASLTLSQDQKYYINAQPHILQGELEEGVTTPERDQLKPLQSGSPRTSFWYRFDIKNTTNTEIWYLDVTNTPIKKIVAHAQSGRHYNMVANGYGKSVPFDLGNAVKLRIPSNSTVSVWLNIQAPHISDNTLISLQPRSLYSYSHFAYTALILIALGAMLALALYNTFLFFPTRDPSFLWYALYQLLCSFAWAAHFKILLYGFNIEMDQSTFYLPFFIAGATSLMFAVSFLRLHARNKSTLAIEGFSIAMILFGVIGLTLPFAIYYYATVITAYIWMLVMLWVGVKRLKEGFKPARFFVLGFSVMTGVFLFILAGNLSGISLLDNNLIVALWAQLFDSVALALALADRINFLRKSRQFADKRATTDQLTGLPNRMAFERDVRAWEAYYSEGIIGDFFLTFIDVDGLKKVNDSKGHNEGDRLLSVISKWITEQANQQNVYRIGGDEFLVLSKNHIQWNLPDLHIILKQAGFPHSDLSIGTSSYSECGSRSQLLKLADERMYVLKKSHR